jgi:preprotein translocase subunit SecA
MKITIEELQKKLKQENKIDIRIKKHLRPLKDASQKFTTMLKDAIDEHYKEPPIEISEEQMKAIKQNVYRLIIIELMKQI